MQIDLAPNHKHGLVAANPIWLAGGAAGYGEAAPKGLDFSLLGGVVIGPLLGGSRGGAPLPRLAHVSGGIVFDTGLQNRGVASAIKQYGRLWSRLGCPVVAQLADTHPATLDKVVVKLSESEGLSGFELLVPPDADANLVTTLVRAAARRSDLPLWVKLPLATAPDLAKVAVDAGAAGIVVGQAMPGAAIRTQSDGETHIVRGALLGPLAFPPMLEVLIRVTALKLPIALLACGGIHTIDQVNQALAAGAQAVQIDSAVWVEPGLPNRLAVAMASTQTAPSAERARDR